jgi:hypothetical protein
MKDNFKYRYRFGFGEIMQVALAGTLLGFPIKTSIAGRLPDQDFQGTIQDLAQAHMGATMTVSSSFNSGQEAYRF